MGPYQSETPQPPSVRLYKAVSPDRLPASAKDLTVGFPPSSFTKEVQSQVLMIQDDPSALPSVIQLQPTNIYRDTRD